MVRKILLFVLIVFGLSFAQDVKVQASTDSSHYRIGDLIKLKFEITHSQTTRVLFPDITDTLNPFEIINSDTVRTIAQKDGSVKELYSFDISAYDSVNNYSKSFSIPYQIAGDSLARYSLSNTIALTVSRLAVDTTREIKDVKSPLSEKAETVIEKAKTVIEKVRRNWYIWVIILILILAATGYFIFRKYYAKPEIVKVKTLTAPEEAYQRIKELDRKQLWQKGKIKEYHTEITGIIRNYFERQFKIIALKLTSNETIAELSVRGVNPDVCQLVDEFFTLADMVKFAKHIPSLETNSRMIEVASKIVESSIRKERTEEGRS